MEGEGRVTDTAQRDQAEIDRLNGEFWDELCGTQLALSLGINDHSAESLARFDAWYFGFYPYLFEHIPFAEMAGQKVLEVGLGYGTVAEKIAASGAHYHGLDIAAGPVAMATNRLANIGTQGDIRQGSINAPPFDEGAFDWVVAIGALHHTGDLKGAIGRVERLLRKGGQATIMVYSALSYRQWLDHPVATFRRALADPVTYQERKVSAERMRAAYDVNQSGTAAPQTEFVTMAELKHMCRRFRQCQIRRENIGAESLLRFVPRPVACRLFGWILGLDLYCRLER